MADSSGTSRFEDQAPTQTKIFPTDSAILQLTPEEKRAYSQLFQQADTDKLGVVTGEIAVKFFEKTKLAPSVLGEVAVPLFLVLPTKQY